MDEKVVQRQIVIDLQSSPRETVIYLEGKTDPEIFFGLLGVPTPNPTDDYGFLHQGVLVRGLDEKSGGSGGKSVQARKDAAAKFKYPGVFGVIDGDGLPLERLAQSFDAPFAGPVFRWKAYCIENLLLKTGWPASFGDAPDWRTALLAYGPYVALNRIYVELRDKLESLGLQKLTKPIPDGPLRTKDEVLATLEKDKHLIIGFDVSSLYKSHSDGFENALLNNIDEAHTMLNGKWLIEHFAYKRTKKSHQEIRQIWSEHAQSVDGLPEVRDLWQRITQSPP